MLCRETYVYMNNFINPVGLFYLFLAFFIFIVPVDSGILIKLITLLYIFLLWFGYSLGTLLPCKRKISIQKKFFKKPKSLFIIFLLIFSQIILSIYAGQYYTGLTIQIALQNLIQGNSNYAIYQEYFNTNNLGLLSISKTLPLFSMFYIKFVFIYILYFFVVRKNHKYDFIVVLFSIFPVIIFAIFRGTSFEFFEVLIALICALYVRSLFNKDYKFPFLKISILAAFLVFIYVLQILFRYKFNYTVSCNNAFCYNYDSFLHQLLPTISSTLYKLSGYFYFAPDYIARWFIYFLDNKLFLTLLIPGNEFLYGYNGKWLCGEEFICGPTWAPDFEIFTYILGLPLTALIIIALAYFQKYLKKAAGISFIDFLGFYLITLQFYAFPVGNFLFVSSANKLMLISFIILFLTRLISKKL